MGGAIENALTEIGMRCERYAKGKCPVDTGLLRNSITNEMQDEKTVCVGSATEYAAYVELGTSKSRAQPYLKPALEEHLDEYIDVVKKYLKV